MHPCMPMEEAARKCSSKAAPLRPAGVAAHSGGFPPAGTHNPSLDVSPLQEADLVRLKREAKAKNGFYVEAEARLMFVTRIRGLNKIHPKVRPRTKPTGWCKVRQCAQTR